MKVFRFGVPPEDAALLVSGFTAPVEHAGEKCRWLAARARLVLPVPAGRAGRATLSAAATCEQELVFSLAGREVGRASLPAGGAWQDVALDLPAADSPAPVLEIRALRPHPLDAFAPRCAMLRSLAVEPAAELPAPDCAGRRQPCPAYRHCFGDIHVHTALSPCARPGGGTIAENCRRARDQMRSDFIAFADHDSRMSDQQWRSTMDQLEEFERPGEFATLVGYEWTSFLFGQINVYSPSRELPLLRCTDEASESPPRLWRELRRWGGPAFTAYHHPTRPGMPADWDLWDEELMPVAEIFSGWGNSERRDAPRQKPGRCVPGTTVQDALSRGCRLGFVGGGDIHDLTPATRGVTGVLVEDLSRRSVFEAIRERRCYATTGERIELDFRVNGHLMGSVLRFSPYLADLAYPLRVEYRVKGTAPLGRVEVVSDGGVVLHSRSIEELGGAAECAGAFQVPNLARGVPSGATLVANRRCLYLRVMQSPAKRSGMGLSESGECELAWSSPVFLVPDWSELL